MHVLVGAYLVVGIPLESLFLERFFADRMKDIQGVQRGKCNTCECEEYRTSPTQPGQLRCEYCNHTPGEHVKIIELGACSSCGKEHCDKYQSEDPNSYTDCEYCGCYAQLHAGADKRKSYV